MRRCASAKKCTFIFLSTNSPVFCLFSTKCLYLQSGQTYLCFYDNETSVFSIAYNRHDCGLSLFARAREHVHN